MSEAADNPNPPAPQLDLAAPRVISMQFGRRMYTWTFRRVMRTDWEKFFRSFDTETTYILGDQEETFEVETGMAELARSCVASVDGYIMPPEGDWRRMLPLGHLKAFGQAMRDVMPIPTPDDAPMPLTELSEVLLDCTWSATEDGNMTTWQRLAHQFNPPTMAQQRAFNRACGTFRVKGNDRGNSTVYPARQALMMDFYDELIVAVDSSYCVHGEALQDRETIIAEMDACHKVAAIQGLLNAGGAGRILHAAKQEKKQEVPLA